MQDKADWPYSKPIETREDQKKSSVPPLSERDRRRLIREWTDANMRGDDEARRRVEDEILGRPAPRNATDACDE